MNPICRVLPHAIGDGPSNMALDEALLDDVAGGTGTAYLRTYGWTIPTLSLGYFQRLEEALSDPCWRSVPLVRRLTGGGAIWHHDEVTYALVVPVGHPLARPSTRLYGAVHSAIGEVLVELGVPAGRRGDTAHLDAEEQRRPFLCFNDRNSEDIVSNGVKLVGSAQRRRVGAVLQHGSILLARSDRVPGLLGVSDVSHVSAEPGSWPDRLIERIPRALGLCSVEVSMPDRVLDRASELERTIYRDPAWTGAR